MLESVYCRFPYQQRTEPCDMQYLLQVSFTYPVKCIEAQHLLHLKKVLRGYTILTMEAMLLRHPKHTDNVQYYRPKKTMDWFEASL